MANPRTKWLSAGFVLPIDPPRLRRGDHQTAEGPKEGPRTYGQRDRDRVLYASAFRRLGGVTQVVMSLDEGHIFHNRLTHSIKVAQVGRRLAEKILWKAQGDGPSLIEIRRGGGLDPDVVEAAALAHDLGHPPFGHIGEQELDRLTVASGDPDGFEGNAQSFRIVTRLAHGAGGDYEGLNLSRATLAAIQKYPWLRPALDPNAKKKPGPPKFGAYRDDGAALQFALEKVRPNLRERERTLEAQIMDWADDITYAVHDVEDFFRARWIPLDRLVIGFLEPSRTSNIALFNETVRDIERLFEGVRNDWYKGDGDPPTDEELLVAAKSSLQAFPIAHPYTGNASDRRLLRAWSSVQIGRFVDGTSLTTSGPESGLTVDPVVRRAANLLKQLTRQFVVGNPLLSTHQHGQRGVIAELHKIYMDALAADGDLGAFPLRVRDQADQSLDRTQQARFVCDVIAGMTELSVLHAHGRLTGHALGPLEDPAAG